MKFRQWFEGQDGPIERTPVSARMRRKITIDLVQGHRDRAVTLDWQPTHRSKDTPKLEIMVTDAIDKHGDTVDFHDPDATVIRFVLSYGGDGSEPAEMFFKRWVPIPASHLN